MAYRWNLDYVKDVHGNAMAYYYNQDTNAYARNGDTSGTTTPTANSTYVRDSHLDHIDYGFTDGNAYTVNGGHAPDQVTFTTGDRCLSGHLRPAEQDQRRELARRAVRPELHERLGLPGRSARRSCPPSG